MIERDSICGNELCRPGGFAITDRALTFCNFEKGASLADIGCGLGATVRHVKQHYALNICGIEKDQDVLNHAKAYSHGETLMAADAEQLPFHDGELNGLIFECSLSKMEKINAVLAECARVLKPQGYLIISDLYSKGKPAQLSGLLGRIDTKEAFSERLEKNHFSIVLFEDYTDSLREMWGQLIFKYGTDALYENLGIDRAGMCAIKCGYCLIIAQKEEDIG